MSGVAGTTPADELVVLAGEYVLGTLPRDEALRLAREAETDPLVAGAISRWEQQLAPLSAQVPPVTPPAALWPRIAASVRFRTGEATTPQGRAMRFDRLRRWQAATAAGFLLAASMAGIAILRQPVAPLPLAVLAPAGAGHAAFVLETHGDGSVSVLPIAPAPVPSDRDLELWSLADGARVPHAIGVLPASGLRLAAGMIPAGPAQIMVSLEPRGGSPTGLPTGPVLYATTLPRPE